MVLTYDEVLEEFAAWLDTLPETPAKRWVRANPPTPRDVLDVTGRLLQSRPELIAAVSAA